MYRISYYTPGALQHKKREPAFTFPLLAGSTRRSMTVRMMYGEQVRAARRKLRLTQDEAARRAGVSKRYFVDIEKNRANVSLEVLLRVVAALGIDELHFGEVPAYFRTTVLHGLAGRLADAESTIAEVRAALRASAPSPRPAPEHSSTASSELLADLQDVAAGAHAAAGFPFAGAVAREDLGRRGTNAMEASHLHLPEALFRAVDFTYPVLEQGSVMRANVLANSMEPLFAAGDVIRIDTALRTPHPGVVFAAHGAAGSALGRIPSNGDPVLVRTHGDPILLGTGSWVVLGAVEKVA